MTRFQYAHAGGAERRGRHRGLHREAGADRAAERARDALRHRCHRRPSAGGAGPAQARDRHRRVGGLGRHRHLRHGAGILRRACRCGHDRRPRPDELSGLPDRPRRPRRVQPRQRRLDRAGARPLRHRPRGPAQPAHGRHHRRPRRRAGGIPGGRPFVVARGAGADRGRSHGGRGLRRAPLGDRRRRHRAQPELHA